ncbi:LysM peptidoglycan-binding domain-containing protein [Mesobacillus jeotgali]|uniref:LysM peptidoglycan-binding domain-containing protein n=1 Tax=Mesobacillus jeotgali TaxID=129985 RepID=A0ABY9VLX7_9BACI|nr:LysM peptidoglycan-binding domain-containing protein [Mesobacillus jeotgali]WNF23857.1 LysM peptidoglycan-binding domain-containing protein [Mesobacillus jeotgali]
MTTKFFRIFMLLLLVAGVSFPLFASAMAEVTFFSQSTATVAYQGNSVPGYVTFELKTSEPTRGYILAVGNGVQTKINLSTTDFKTVHKVEWVPWDDTKKVPLPAGEYQLKAYLSDQGYNQMQGYPLGKLTVVNETNPKPLIDQVSINPSVFAPKYGGTETIQIPFNLNRPAEVQLSIWQNGAEVYGGDKIKLLPGSHSVSWNGKDNAGRVVADGTYDVNFAFIETAYNYPATRQSGQKAGTVTIKDGDYNIPLWRVKQVVTDGFFSSDVISPDGDGINDTVSGQFTLAEPAKVSIYIANAAGAHVKNIFAEQSFQAGTHTFSWDGTDFYGGKAVNGSYYIRAMVIEGASAGYITLTDSVRFEGGYEVKALQPEKRVRVVADNTQLSVYPAGQGYTAVKGDTFPLISETIENGRYEVLVKEGVSGTINVSDVELVADSDVPGVPTTIDYTVVSGDTLWKIAAKFNTTISEIVKLNNLDPNKYLFIGQKLKVPAADSPEPAPQPVIHSVQSGDTLWKIAQKYGTTIDSIVKANNLDPAKYLYIGQKLTIPSSTPNQEPPAVEPVVHEVVSGDTLWKISVKYSTTIDVIVKANNLDPAKYLYIGQKLTIPR